MDLQSEEKELLLDHDFDGIQELDNDLPPWLMWVFYVTIFFSAIYMVHYHAFEQGELQADEYASEVTAYEQTKGEGQTTIELKLLTDTKDITAGKELFVKMNCGACHGNAGEGNQVGPNLTDKYWINGGKLEDVVTVIDKGNLPKGMTSFGNQINQQQILQLASYVLISLQGTNPPNAKEPQGEEVK